MCSKEVNLFQTGRQFLEWYEEKNTTESIEIELETVTEESCK